MKTKVIKSANIAKILLQQGFIIKDIAPHKADSKRTIFVFHNSDQLESFLLTLNKEGE